MQSQHCHPWLLYSIKANRLCIWISLGKPLFEIRPLKSRELLSLTANDFNYRWCRPSEALYAGEKNIFLFPPQQDGRLSETDAEMLSHPSDVSIGLLSCNNLISQRHTSTGLWQHLMRVALCSSVSNFMTSPLFYSMAHSGLWTCNNNLREKQYSTQLCAKSFCQELKLWMYAYDCMCVQSTGDENNYQMILPLLCVVQIRFMFFFQHINGVFIVFAILPQSLI